MDCIEPIRITKGLSRKEYPDGLEVGCGKCYLCRMQKRREWKMRLWHENEYHDQSAFVTLTYSDENIPPNGSLKKSDLQNFIKRLRNYFPPRTIKHYSVGEYGGQTFRPHYHSLIFGTNNSDIIESLWTCGMVHIGTVTTHSIEYVAGYIDKKMYGDTEELMTSMQGREKYFKLSSNGLGKQFAIDHADQISENGCVTMYGKKFSVPRYYLKVLGLKLDKFNDDSIVKKLLGLNYSLDEIYKIAEVNEIKKVNDQRLNENHQREKNLVRKMQLKKRVL